MERDGFAAEFGQPPPIGNPQPVDPTDEGGACPYCQATTLTSQTYSTELPDVRVAFYWCAACNLGHMSAWDTLIAYTDDPDTLGPRCPASGEVQAGRRRSSCCCTHVRLDGCQQDRKLSRQRG